MIVLTKAVAIIMGYNPEAIKNFKIQTGKKI
jgi:hypothetical protein